MVTRKSLSIFPQAIICIFDATHIGENLLLTAREPNLKVNLAWSWIESETKEAYAELKQNLESRGFVLLVWFWTEEQASQGFLKEYQSKSVSSTNWKSSKESSL